MPSVIVTPTLSTQRSTRHPKYYLNGGDLHLLVRGQLFRVHSYFFDRDATRFFPVANCGHIDNRGDSDYSPIIVDVDPVKFEKLLWVFYNPTYSLYDASVEDWVDILELSHEWKFTQVKRLALRELQKLDMPTVDRIALYQKHQVDVEYLVPLYAELCTRAEILSVDEAQLIGLPATIIICRLREQLRGPATVVIHLPPVNTTDAERLELWRRVAEAFNYPPEAGNGPAGYGAHPNRPTTNGRAGGRGNRYSNRP